MRGKLKEKIFPVPTHTVHSPSLKFGAFNVNGLDLEGGWAVGQLLTTRNFNAS